MDLRFLRYLSANLLVAIGYFVGGQVGLLLAIPPSNAAAVWPAAGVAIAAILISGKKVIPGIMLGSILVHTASYLDQDSVEKILTSFAIGSVIAAGTALHALVGLKLVGGILEKDKALLKEFSIIKFSLLAGPVSCLVSSSIGIATLYFQGILTPDDIPLAWSTWWIGDSIGVVVFTPILLCFFGEPRELWRQRINNVALPLCILTIASFVIFKTSYSKEMQSIESGFESSALQVKRELQNRLNAHIYATRDVKRLFTIVEVNDVTKDVFARITEPALTEYSNIHALEWIPKVLHSERAAFEESMGDVIKAKNEQGEIITAPHDDHYYVIKYVEPFVGNEAAYLYNVRSTPETEEATTSACSSGDIAVTDSVKLIQETKEQVSLVFYEPVYGKYHPADMVQTCDNLLGFIASVFRLEHSINTIHEQVPRTNVLMSLHRDSRLIYSDKDYLKEKHTIPSQFNFYLDYHINVANKIWHISFEPGQGFIASYSSWAIWLIIVGGLLVSGLSGIGLMMLTGRALATEELVKQRTQELHSEIQERKLAQESLTYQASHDSLTGLVNRREFEKRAQKLLEDVRENNSEHTMCFMDLDQFKIVNDTGGHNAGDELLRQLSNVLREKIRHNDLLARLGGDEFGVLMESCHVNDAIRVAELLKQTIHDFQFAWEDKVYKVGASIGLVSITKHVADLTELLKEADAACYMAKDMGRNCIHVYRSEDIELAQRHGEMQWVTRIQKALEEDRFVLYAQKIAPLDTAKQPRYEILIRLKDEAGKIIPPGAFLPAAERYNLIEKLDRWVIRNTFSTLGHTSAFMNNSAGVSINISGQSLTRPDFFEYVVSQLEETEIDSSKICFEITETSAIANLSAARDAINSLMDKGCKFALDDFGSGLSSFGYLKNFPVNYLKIDGMFIKDMADDEIDYAMVKSINEIGHTMNMQTIAEFVENNTIVSLLEEIGVDFVQGYGIEKPMPITDIMLSYT